MEHRSASLLASLCVSLIACGDTTTTSDAATSVDGAAPDAMSRDAGPADAPASDLADALSADATAMEDAGPPELKAFPTAYGGGSAATGGRGYPVYKVTNLNDFGEGSFMQALENAKASGGGNIVFDVSGIIEFTTASVWEELNNVSILGQTAPQGGITFSARANNRVQLLYSNNVIIRYVRFRSEWAQGAHDGMDLISSSNVVFDHCSISWGGDEAISTRSWIDIPSNNISYQRLLIGESATGSLMGNGDDYDDAINQSMHQNLFFNVSHRFPNVSSNGRMDIINNVVYDWSARMSNFFGDAEVNYINNYFGLGQRSPFSVEEDGSTKNLNMVAYDNVDDELQIFARGTYIDNDVFTDPEADNRALFYHWSPPDYRQNERASLSNFTDVQHALLGSPIPILSATDNFEDVVSDVGANAYTDDNGVPQRESDAVDSDYLAIVRSGGFEDYRADNGDFLYALQPRYAAHFASITGTPIHARSESYDTDDDGMPDVWEAAEFGDLSRDGTLDADGDGYTDLEEFFNLVDG